jgi:uncharacterized membrane protein YfcA
MRSDMERSAACCYRDQRNAWVGNIMLLIIIVVALVAVGIAFVTFLVRAAISADQLSLRLEPSLLSAVTNFFDTLGIGSFAPTMAWMRFRRMVPDQRIPMTMLAGYTPSTFVQSIIFLILLGVGVDPVLLIGSAAAVAAGAYFGVPLAVGSSVRTVQLFVAAALLLAASFYSLSNLGLMPAGGSASSLPLAETLIAIAASFIFGALLNFGIGNYAPTLAMLSLMGLDPRLVFPIMATGSTLAGAAAATRLVKLADLDLRIVLSLAVGSIPAVLIAAFLVKEMDLVLLRWLVVVVVTYAAFSLIFTALRKPAFGPEEQLERALVD